MDEVATIAGRAPIGIEVEAGKDYFGARAASLVISRSVTEVIEGLRFYR